MPDASAGRFVIKPQSPATLGVHRALLAHTALPPHPREMKTDAGHANDSVFLPLHSGKNREKQEKVRKR